MKAYRISRKDSYGPGDVIWEASPGENNRHNMHQFMAIILSNNQNAVDNIPQLPTDQITPAYIAIKEAALEIIRAEEYSSLPGRFDTMMVFQYIDHAKFFLKQYRSLGFFLYEIDVSLDTLPFTGDMKMIDDVHGQNIGDYLAMARRYWSGAVTENPMMESILVATNCARVVAKL